jgi:hypothetical protein
MKRIEWFPLGATVVIASAALGGLTPTISPLVLEGDDVPTIGLVTTIDGIAVNNAGTWLVQADTNNADTEADNVVLRNGTLMLREGQPIAPSPATLDSFDSLTLNNAGESGYNFSLAGTAGTMDDSGVYFGPGSEPFTPALVYQESDVAPDLSKGTPFIGFFDVKINNPTKGVRQLLIMSSVDDPAIATTVDRALYRIDVNDAGAATGSTLIAAEADVLPGQTEAVADFGTGPHTSAINDAGDVMFVADLTPTTATDGVVYLNSTIIAQEGSPSPIADRNWATLSTSVRVDLNNTGGYVHTGTLAGDTASDLVIIADDGKVIQEGDTLPAIGGTFTFTGFGSGPVEIDDNGNVLWYGDWNDGDTTIDEGLFLNDQLLMQEGVTTVDGVVVDIIRGVEDGYHMSNDGSHIIVEVELVGSIQGAVMITFVAPCPADTDGSGAVDVDDLIAVILGWGDCPAPPDPCDADIDGTGAVDVDDLIAVILAWGPCA